MIKYIVINTNGSVKENNCENLNEILKKRFKFANEKHFPNNHNFVCLYEDGEVDDYLEKNELVSKLCNIDIDGDIIICRDVEDRYESLTDNDIIDLKFYLENLSNEVNIR